MLTGGAEWRAVDRNGKRVLKLQEKGLQIINGSEKCEGKWTWMAGGRKSEIDYVLVDKQLEGKIVKMEIDEEGKNWKCGGGSQLDCDGSGVG